MSTRKNAKKKDTELGILYKFQNYRRKLVMEIEIFKMIFQNFKSAPPPPLVLLIFITFAGIMYSVFYFSLSKNNQIKDSSLQTQSQKINF